jgi:uncharacterized membrane protein YfhO
VDEGRVVESSGLLGVLLDKKGSYTVKLTYVPFDFYSGLIISVVSFLLSGYLLIFKSKSSLKNEG